MRFRSLVIALTAAALLVAAAVLLRPNGHGLLAGLRTAMHGH